MEDHSTFQRQESGTPLRLTLICSDDPQHIYLRYLLDQAFENYQCIIESNAGQVRHLKAKNRTLDLRYMGYHSKRRKWTGDSKARSEFFASLVPKDYTPSSPSLSVDSVNCKAVWDQLENWKPEVTIVAGTKYIGKSAISRGGMMINLHTGHLPDYKGNQCIFFALYDGAFDKIAGTLHQLSSELDGGPILEKLLPPIYTDDSEEKLYARCQKLMINRIVELVKGLEGGATWHFTPQPHKGRMFRHRDRTPIKDIALWWRKKTGRLNYPHWVDREAF